MNFGWIIHLQFGMQPRPSLQHGPPVPWSCGSVLCIAHIHYASIWFPKSWRSEVLTHSSCTKPSEHPCGAALGLISSSVLWADPVSFAKEVCCPVSRHTLLCPNSRVLANSLFSLFCHLSCNSFPIWLQCSIVFLPQLTTAFPGLHQVRSYFNTNKPVAHGSPYGVWKPRLGECCFPHFQHKACKSFWYTFGKGCNHDYSLDPPDSIAMPFWVKN